MEILVDNKSSVLQSSDSYLERPQLDFNAVKVEIEEPDDSSRIVQAAETTNIKMEDIAANESTGELMLVAHVSVAVYLVGAWSGHPGAGTQP